ncbi:hypothetical protein GPALN_003485 [Globodera pallida]|uniref:Uncharacterized protein n=1 Tax=Globodera pallida TaxID=36090 RepID=A0A183C1M0_GLOPA|nr:hypothetical protein GPALN_003485 [Globodera pallida]
MNGILKQHGEQTFTECRHSSKSHSFTAMELVDEIHSDDENGTADDVIYSDDGTADDVIFVCTSTASASSNESDEMRQRQQQMNEQSTSQHSSKSAVKHSFAAMELVDEIHSDDENGTADDVIYSDDGTADDVIFMCTSTASASSNESDEICHLPLTNRVLPPFPSLDANLLAEFDDIDVANETSPAEELAQKFARQNIRSIDRAKAILQLFDSGPISAADTCEQEELKPSPECQTFCSMPFQLIEEDEEIEYIGTVKRSAGN